MGEDQTGACDGNKCRGEDPHRLLEGREGMDSEPEWRLNLRRKESPSPYQAKRRRVQIQEWDRDQQDGGPMGWLLLFFGATGDEVIC